MQRTAGIAQLASVLGGKHKKGSASSGADTTAGLLQDIRTTKDMIDNVTAKFNLADNQDLIEAYIYELNSLNCRLEYLIKQAKEEKVKVPLAQVQTKLEAGVEKNWDSEDRILGRVGH